MNCEISLNADSLKTEVKFATKCINKNTNKNSADNAIANFRPIDDWNKDSFAIELNIVLKETNLEKLKSFNNELCQGMAECPLV